MYGWLLATLATWVGSLAALRYPLIGLNVYVALAILRPQFIFSFAGSLSGLSIIVGSATLIGWALKGLGAWRLGRGRAIVLPYVVFLILFSVSSVFALDSTVAFSSVWELSKVALPFFVGFTMIRGEKDWRPLIWTIVLSQGYVAYEMNLNYLVKGFNSAADGFGGMDNNCFAVSLLVVLGPALALMLWSKSWWERVVAGMASALILHAILLTFSRGGMVGLLAFGAVLFIMMPKRPTYVAVVLAVSLLTVRFVGPQLYARYASAFVEEEQRDTSAQSRVDLWRDCLRVINEYPILGVGPANWRIVVSNYGWTAGKSAHSVWMETAAEVGLPAGLALLSVFLGAIVSLWHVARSRLTDENRNEMVLAAGVILAAVGFIVAGQFVSIPALEAPYYIVMLGAAMLRDRKQPAPAGVRVAPPSRIRPRELPAAPVPPHAARTLTVRR